MKEVYQNPKARGYIKAFQGFIPHLVANQVNCQEAFVILRPCGTFQVLEAGMLVIRVMTKEPEAIVLPLFDPSPALQKVFLFTKSAMLCQFNEKLRRKV